MAYDDDDDDDDDDLVAVTSCIGSEGCASRSRSRGKVMMMAVEAAASISGVFVISG